MSTSPNTETDPLPRQGTLGLAEQVAARVVERIRQQVYASGMRLPSVRQCAASQGVSAATVVSAYERLVAQGWIEARPQKGFFVRPQAAHSAVPAQKPKGVAVFRSSDATENVAYRMTQALYTHAPVGVSAPPPSAPMPAAQHATALVRGMFSNRRVPQPGLGVLPPDWLDNRFAPAALRAVVQQDSQAGYSLVYGDPAGDAGLRQAVAQRLADLHISCAPQHIVTTLGATHGLDIAVRALLRPGDAVMVEEPGWVVEFARLAALGMRVLPVPRGVDGPSLEVMRQHCAHPDPAQRPKLFVSVSVLHNPTGACLTPALAHAVLQLAQAHDFHILEDDTYAHFASDHAVRLAALDAAQGLNRVFYVGGFAKALAPNWRVGFVAAPAHWLDALIDAKLLASLTTPALQEKAMALVMAQGHLRKHCERLKTKLAAARARSTRLAQAAGCSFVSEPAGVFGWIDAGCDTDRLAAALADEGVMIAPGSLFYAQRRPSQFMRINFSTTQEPGFWQKLQAARDRL